MLLKKATLALAAGAALAASVPASARPPHWAPSHGRHAKHHHPHHSYLERPPVVIVQPWTYYYYVPPPAVAYPPAPIFPGWSVRIGLRL